MQKSSMEKVFQARKIIVTFESTEYALLSRSPGASNIDTSLNNKDLEQRKKLKLDHLYTPYL